MAYKRRQWKKEIPPTRNYSIIIGFLGLVGICIYPTIIHPMIFPDSYEKVQKENRKGINQEDIQPGNMRVWRDPFDRKKNNEK